MMTFWIAAGVLSALALLFLLPSLLGKSKAVAQIDRDDLNAEIARERLAALEAEFEQGAMDEDAYQAARDEVERGLLDDVEGRAETQAVKGGAASHWSPVVIGVLVPALAVWTYLQLGEINAVEHRVAPVRTASAPQAAQPDSGNPHAEGAAQGEAMPPIADLADKLAARLENDPENLEGWTMLARTYDVLERYADAASAYQMAVSLAPEDPELLVNLAEALAMTNDGDLQGQPRELIDQARGLSPNHGKTLWYSGMSRFQSGNEYQQAADLWMQLLVQMDENSEAYAQVAEMVRQAAARGGFEAPLAAEINTLPSIEMTPVAQAAEPAPAQTAPAQPTSAGAAAIGVSVRLSETVADRVAPGDTLFVYARAAQGPRMPLAIVRVTADQLPFETELNDAQAMMPQMKLSSFPEVVVGARISRSGQAIAQPGDVFGEISPVVVADGGSVDILIDQVK